MLEDSEAPGDDLRELLEGGEVVETQAFNRRRDQGPDRGQGKFPDSEAPV